MTMPPWSDDAGAIPALLCAAARAWPSKPACSELSMGMSHDLEVAIEEGATMVRIGTALFGPTEKRLKADSFLRCRPRAPAWPITPPPCCVRSSVLGPREGERAQRRCPPLPSRQQPAASRDLPARARNAGRRRAARCRAASFSLGRAERDASTSRSSSTTTAPGTSSLARQICGAGVRARPPIRDYFRYPMLKRVVERSRR